MTTGDMHCGLKTWILFWLCAGLALVAPEAPVRAADPEPAGPPELKKLLGEYLQIRMRDIEFPISERITKLDKSYVAALKRGIEKASNSGDLDTVLEMRKEIERIEAGKPLGPDEEFKTERGRALAGTYLSEMRVILAENEKLKAEFAKKLGAALGTLQTSLTKEQRFDDAVAVRNFRDGSGVLDYLSGHEAMIPQLPRNAAGKTASAGEADGPSSREVLASIVRGGREGSMQSEKVTSETPLAPPSVPAGDSLPCRIVMVCVDQPDGADIPGPYEAVAADDRTDIVSVGRMRYPNVGAIRADGAMLYWTEGSQAPEVIRGSTVFCAQSVGTPFVGLDADGTLNWSSDTDAGWKDELEDLEGLSALAATADALGVVTKEEGKVIVAGRSTHPTAVTLQTLEGVQSLEFAGLISAHVLKRDGTIMQVFGASIDDTNASGRLVRLHSPGQAEDRSGRLVSYLGVPEEVVDDVARNPRQVFAMPDTFVAAGSDGKFHFWRREDDGRWTQMKDYEAALHGATSFGWQNGQPHSWISVTLPANTVPRSGAWNVSELVKARTAAR